jgi:O-antigen/teichoic acid export membrane protein
MRNLFFRLYYWVLNDVLSSRKGIEDVIVSMVPQVVAVLTGLVTSVLIARGIGPEGMGKYALILSISGLAVSLSDMGIGQTAIRFASQAVSQNDTVGQLAILRWAFRLRILLVLLTSSVAYFLAPSLAVNIWHDDSLSSLVRLSLLTGIFTSMAAIPTIYYQSLKRFKMNATVNVGQILLTFIGIVIIAILNRWSLEIIIALSILTSGVGAITFMILIPRASLIVHQEFQLSFKQLLNKLWQAPNLNDNSNVALDSTGANTFAFFMILSTIIVSIIIRADVWMMGFYLEKAQIGIYSVASRFTLPLVIGLSALNTALFPRASALSCLTKTRELLGKTFRLSMLVAFAGLLYSVIAPLSIGFIFGAAYEKGALLGQILCLRYSIAILTCPIAVIGYSLGMVKIYWWINLLQLIAVVVINYLLLPKIGALGSALALIANEMITFTLVGFILWRRVAAMKLHDSKYGKIL